MADKEFDILLAVKADTAGLAEINRQAALTQDILALQKDQEAIMAEILGTTVATTAAQEELATASLLTGANLSRARGEAITLVRELETGSVSMRTVGALAGSLGTSLSIAGVAGLAIYNVVSRLGETQVTLNEKVLEMTQELGAQVEEWDLLAAKAEKFADVVSLAAKGVQELGRLAKQTQEAQSTQLNFGEKLVDSILTAPGIDQSPIFSAARDEAIKRAQDTEKQGLVEIVAKIDQGTDSANRFAAALADPGKYLPQFQQDLSEAKAKLDQLGESKGNSRQALDAWTEQGKLVTALGDQVKKLTDEETQHANSIQKSKDATALLKAEASGNDEAVIAEKVRQKYDEIYQAKLKAHSPDAEAKELATQESQALEAQLQHQLEIKNAAAGTKEERQEEAEALRDAALHLQAIKASMSLIGSDPFMTAGDKARLQYQLLEQTIKLIVAQITQLKSQIAGGFFDPQHIDQARQKLVAYQVELTKTRQEAAKLGSGIKSDLMEWANQFGTVSHQIAGLITDTIGGAINSLASGISGLIFQTQTLGQAALQFGEQFVSSLIRIGLQMLAQFLLGQVLGEASSAAASAIATPIALAYAPAAALASTASYGGAAVAGQAALTESVLAAKGLASLGGFEQGGYTGPAGGVVHGNEYVIDSTSLGRAGGPAFFDNLRVALNQRGGPRGATSPGGGGPTGGGHHFYLVHRPRITP